ncbi:MAG: hypothetical protein QMD09_06735 [Desulfatibacillaceae bacterium]|nr:hypothetical protein [Desulfatibacillaceae bacterium]
MTLKASSPFKFRNFVKANDCLQPFEQDACQDAWKKKLPHNSLLLLQKTKRGFAWVKEGAEVWGTMLLKN